MRTVISVDQTRETISFFGSTAAVEGWRVCIVDTVDELNPNAANALLKVLEEPPQQSLFLLVSHAPARVLPTILSRCRKLMLRPLSTEDVIRAASQALGIAADDPALGEAAAASEGSVARALTLLGGDTLETAAAHGGAACEPAAGRSARIACAGGSARHQRPGGAVGLCRQRRSVDGRTAAHGQCQCEPAPPCTAGGGMGKDRPRRARHPGLQSGTKTAGFLGVLDACGRDAVGDPGKVGIGFRQDHAPIKSSPEFRCSGSVEGFSPWPRRP